MSKLGVLLIGGKRSHQENHALVFSEHPRCRLIAVADEPDAPQLRHELNQELADDHGIPYIRNVDEALARSDVHIVSMCARIERRGVVAVKCAEAGKHVYLDKPLCGSVEAADAIVEAMDKSRGREPDVLDGSLRLGSTGQARHRERRVWYPARHPLRGNFRQGASRNCAQERCAQREGAPHRFHVPRIEARDVRHWRLPLDRHPLADRTKGRVRYRPHRQLLLRRARRKRHGGLRCHLHAARRRHFRVDHRRDDSAT